MPRELKRIAILIGVVVVGLALFSLLLKGVFLLFRLAIIVAVIGAAVLLFRALQNTWRKSRCEKCGTFLVPSEQTVAMSADRLRALIDTGSLATVTALLRPKDPGTTSDVTAWVRTCPKCNGTTWLKIVTSSGEVLLEEQKIPHGLG